MMHTMYMRVCVLLRNCSYANEPIFLFLTQLFIIMFNQRRVTYLWTGTRMGGVYIMLRWRYTVYSLIINEVDSFVLYKKWKLLIVLCDAIPNLGINFCVKFLLHQGSQLHFRGLFRQFSPYQLYGDLKRFQLQDPWKARDRRPYPGEYPTHLTNLMIASIWRGPTPKSTCTLPHGICRQKLVKLSS